MSEVNKVSIPATKVRAYVMDSDTTLDTLHNIGIGFSDSALREFMAYAGYGMDAAPSPLTTPSVPNAVQFFQYWLTNVIKVVTQARVADKIAGRDINGSWEDEEIVATVAEGIGQARPYGDKTDLNLATYNVNFERRTIVRFEQDIEVGTLEEARAAKMRINSSDRKRVAAGESLAISMNDVAFRGYNSQSGRTYGYLNDPYLPAYQTVATGAGGGTEWSGKTYLEICNDIKVAMSALRVRSGYNFDPYSEASVLAVAGNAIDFLATQNELGTKSVREWIRETYPNCRVEAIPQFSGANATASVFYLQAENIAGEKVVRQNVQDVFRMIGVAKLSKGFVESFSNATAGVMYEQPIGVVRYTGI